MSIKNIFCNQTPSKECYACVLPAFLSEESVFDTPTLEDGEMFVLHRVLIGI
jgi:hypothetical protein